MRTDRARQISIRSTSLPAVLPAGWARLSSPGWPLLVGVSVMVVYLLLLPHVERTWRATGDEPHYLLAAHSLVYDLDFDLANNYGQLDYLAFYFSREIEPQIRTNRAGQQILNHQLGLPALIAPVYALGGRAGVLVFQAILGGLLAALTFKLARLISGDEQAALLAALMVALTPPVGLYQYLVYPELPGAALTTVVLYLVISRDRPGTLAIVGVMLALAALPWLNRRFAPLALVLAVLVAWSWRKKSFWPGFAALAATLVSLVLLWGLESQLSQPVRADIVAPADAAVLWSRLGRGVGWLVDQQRGLFILAPVYILALWGVPFLVADSYRSRNRYWSILLPFALTLAVTVLAGGYWVAWEVGPRFLVVALPALTPALALAWRYYRHRPGWVGLALVLAALTLLNGWLIIRNPELPYKSSLPRFYSDRLGLPLIHLLPDLAGHASITPTGTETGMTEDGQPVGFAPAGQSQLLLQSGPRQELPFGHFQLSWPVRIEPGLPAKTPILRLSANFLGGGQFFNRLITAADLPADGSYGRVTFSFFNPNVDRWRTPLVFHAVSSGASQVWSQAMLITPKPLYAWFLPYACLGLMAGASLLAWYRRQQRVEAAAPVRLFGWPRYLGWGVVIGLLAIAAIYLSFEANRAGRSYAATDLAHRVGQAVADPAAGQGQAWLVDPQRDSPQLALYGPFDFYDQGKYHIIFRLKLLQPMSGSQELARLRVRTAANQTLFVQSLRPEHFSWPNLYHDFVLVVDNPRRQALSFEVDYLGVAALAIAEVEVREIKNDE